MTGTLASGAGELAGSAGDIALRVEGAKTLRLPVPPPRGPGPQDAEGGPDPVRGTPPGGQIEPSARSEIPS